MPVDQRISQLNLLNTLAAGDLFAVVDVSEPDVNIQTKRMPASLLDARYLLPANNLSDLTNVVTARTNLGLAAMATVADAPSDGSTYGRNNGAWAAVSPLPVDDDTPLVYRTGFAARTVTLDATALTAARVVTVPDAAFTLAGLELANVFTAVQKVNVNSATALLVEQDGVKDNVLVVDTTNGRVGIGNGSPGNQLSINTPNTADANTDVFIASSAITKTGMAIQALTNQTAKLFEGRRALDGRVDYSIAADFTIFQRAAWATFDGKTFDTKTYTMSAGSQAGNGGNSVGQDILLTLSGSTAYSGNSYNAQLNTIRHTCTTTVKNATGMTNISWITGAGNTTTAIGLRNRVQTSSVGTIAAAYGEYCDIEATGVNSRITNAYAGFYHINSVTFAGGIWVNCYGLYVKAPVATGQLTNIYGLYIEHHSVGVTLNYAIYTNAGLNRFGDQVAIVGSADRDQLNVTGFTTQTLSPAVITGNTATTNAVVNVLRLIQNTTGTGANGLGAGLSVQLESSTTAAQDAGRLTWAWVDATHASRAARGDLSAYYVATERTCISWGANATVPLLSFYGGGLVARGAALTAQLTTLTHTAPGAPDYAIQDFVDVALGAGWAFASHDEANSVLSVIANLQTRVAELEARLGSATGVNLFA